jgi:hypothetical protein
MAWDGTATYDTGTSSIKEDVSQYISMISPTATPLLDLIGNPPYAATSTTHVWLEDGLRLYAGQLAEADDGSETTLDVDDGTRYLANDIIMIGEELMSVTSISTNTLTVVRGYGDTTGAAHDDNEPILILGNHTTEGLDAAAGVSTTRSKKTNYTQIIRPATIDISDTLQAVSQQGGIVEYEHQKGQRILEAIRSLEGFVINGSKSASASADGVEGTMGGIKMTCSTNVTDASSAALTESYFNARLEAAVIAGADPAQLNFCLASPTQKRKISGFMTPIRRADADAGETFKNIVSTYESDFGTIMVIMSRWLHAHEIVFGASQHLAVLPLTGRSFQHKALGVTGSSTRGFIEGEYTCEVRHEVSHGWVYNLAT